MEWVRGKLLGKGSYGSVFLAIPTNPLSPLLAAKSALMKNCASLHKEKAILENLSGFAEIVQCYGSCLSLERATPIYNLLLEFASGGCLSDLIIKYGGKIPEYDVRQYARMVLKGLSCIHNNGYVHCDLKPANILVFPSQQDGSLGNLKIADFGLAKEPGEDDSDKSSKRFSFRGTPLYMSPESVALAEITPALDIWSLGCIVVEMITGKTAWDGLDIEELLIKLVFENETPKIPEIMSEKGKDFLKRCFTKDPTQRWTADMLLHHSFIHDDEELDLISSLGAQDGLPDDFAEFIVNSPGRRYPCSIDEPLLNVGRIARDYNYVDTGCRERKGSLRTMGGQHCD